MRFTSSQLISDDSPRSGIRARQVIVEAEFALFVRDSETGRLVFNSDAIRALGLSPQELTMRGYALNVDISAPAIVPDDVPVAG